MELERTYTDVVYAAKRDVAIQMGYHLIEPVWKQILQYRQQWMVQIDDVEVCLCPGILKKMMTLDECLFQLHDTSVDELENLIETESGKWMMHHLLKTEGTFETRLHQLCLLYQSDESKIIKVNQQCPYVLVFVLWCFITYGQSEFGILLILLRLKCAGMSTLLSVVDSSDFIAEKQQDMTYVLDTCLKKWISKAQKNLFSCSYKPYDEDLSYMYPQLKKYQIEFYLDHHTPGYYYTIEQFIRHCGVCYETGRTAMEQLVSLGFYAKMKQGKKFVYTAR